MAALTIDTLDCLCSNTDALFDLYVMDLNVRNSLFSMIDYGETDEFNQQQLFRVKFKDYERPEDDEPVPIIEYEIPGFEIDHNFTHSVK